MAETTIRMGTGVLLLAVVLFGVDPAMWTQWGLAGLVVGYNMWRDSYRQRRMSEELQRHQTWVRNTLLEALERNTAALERMAARPMQGQK